MSVLGKALILLDEAGLSVKVSFSTKLLKTQVSETTFPLFLFASLYFKVQVFVTV